MLQRSSEDNKILIQNNDGQEVLLNEEEFLAQIGADGVIRIPTDEYKNINKNLEYFAHFNLENTGHLVGKKYILAIILRNGSYDNINNVEVLPLLSTKNAYIAECVEVKNFIQYKDINIDLFKYSMTNIQSVDELKNTIIKRYTKSMPHLSTDEIINLGVGYTLLKFK